MEAELLAAASALERHVASNPANGRTVLITAKRAANYPDLTGMGLAFRQCAQTPGLPTKTMISKGPGWRLFYRGPDSPGLTRGLNTGPSLTELL